VMFTNTRQYMALLQLTPQKSHKISFGKSSLAAQGTPQTAFSLLRQAAHLGHAPSLLRLGLAHRTGNLSATVPAWSVPGSSLASPASNGPKFDVELNPGLAMHYLTLAARRGSSEADYEIANSLVWGVGPSQGLASVIPPAPAPSIQRSASRRNPSLSSTSGPAVSPAPLSPALPPAIDTTGMYAPQALTHALLAAKAEIPDSFALVAMVYEVGVDGWIKRNEMQALKWYLRGAAKGDRFAIKKADMLRVRLR
jgi:TPR repeat protein